MAKTAVVLFNLGGPDAPEAVEPFLFNLFNDGAIITLPQPVRWLLARLIARRRAPMARAIYAKIGGGSPLLANTRAQAEALGQVLGPEYRCFLAMRYWQPFTRAAAEAVSAWQPDRIVLLPLYPQFSTTTTASSVRAWHQEAARLGLSVPEASLCCYPEETGFIAAVADLVRTALRDAAAAVRLRVLFSAHGLPKKIVNAGDPYQKQVERTAAAIVAALDRPELDSVVCYQSRVGPLEWIGPSTDDEIRRAGRDGCGVVVVPIAFVSEHSETLVELDIEYRHLAEQSGVPHYWRVPTVGTHPAFIEALARLVRTVETASGAPRSASGVRSCPTGCGRCPMAVGNARRAA
jgi:ferrochelatase